MRSLAFTLPALVFALLLVLTCTPSPPAAPPVPPAPADPIEALVDPTAGETGYLPSSSVTPEAVSKWDENREQLWKALPTFDGDQAAYDAAVARFGRPKVQSEDLENRHIPGQTDQRLVLDFGALTAQVYRANLDPVKYIGFGTVITGKIGVQPIDRLFGLTRQELEALFGPTKPLEDAAFALGPVHDGRRTNLFATFQADRVATVVYTAEVD